jgi:hypothetical protein
MVRSWLCTQELWNPEADNTFGAAARYRRAIVGNSYDDAHPDNSTPHTGKIYSAPLHISRVVLLLLRQRRGAAAATWAPRSSTCEKQLAAPRASAQAYPNNSTLHEGKICSFPLHISRFSLYLLGLGTTIKYPRRTTGAAAGNGLGKTLNYLRGVAGNGRAQR